MSLDNYMQSARNYLTGVGSDDFIENYSKFVDSLSKLSWGNLQMAYNSIGEGPMTLCALGLLTALSRNSELNSYFEPFLRQFSNFMDTADVKVLRTSVSYVSEIAEVVVEKLMSRQQELLGLNFIASVVKKIQNQPTELTSIHPWLLQLCLSSKCLKGAEPYLIEEIDGFSADIKGSDCRPLLLYLYYAGVIHAAGKKFDKALYFFEACLRTPAVTLSHIMVEAYKKFVLISLIKYNTVSQLSKPASQVIHRILKPACSQYMDVCAAFNNAQELNAVVAKHESVFTYDQNYGLVKQVVQAQIRCNLKRLTKTFLTLSLADVAARVGLPDAVSAEKYVRNMIMDRSICAKIDQRNGNVYFLDGPGVNEKDFASIQDKVESCLKLNSKLAEMNERLATNPDYVSKVLMSTNDEEGISSSKAPTYNAL